jgi:hypothetical protein
MAIKENVETPRLIGTRAEIYNKVFKSVRFEYPYASFEMQSRLSKYIESRIWNMELDVKEFYREWVGDK